MIEERLKITNLEERLKTEMSGGVMGNEIGATAEALRMAMQQEDRMKLEMGNIKNMESMLGNAGMSRMLQMMESDSKNFGAIALQNPSGFESGPTSSSGSLPQSPKNHGHEQSPGYSPGASQSHQNSEGNNLQITYQTPPTNNSAPQHAPPLQPNHTPNHPSLHPPQLQQIRRDVELTKVTGNEANLHYQREIGSHHSMSQSQYQKESDDEDEDDDDEMNDAVAVYPKDMSGDNQMGYRKEMAMEVPMTYPQSPMTGGGHPHAHSHIQPPMTGSE